MATVSAKVYEHHKKEDGTYNVKIVLYHKQERRTIETSHFISKKQLELTALFLSLSENIGALDHVIPEQGTFGYGTL